MVETDEDVFGHGLIFNQHEVLVDHANTFRDRHPYGGELETDFSPWMRISPDCGL